MFEEYEDMFCEPSATDEIIERAVSDFRALLTDRVMNLIKDAAGAEKELDRINSEIRSKQYKLSRIEKETEDAEKRAEESDKFKIPRIYIQRFVRDAIGDYAPGDTVFVIENRGKYVCCPTCEGHKKISVHIGEAVREVQCPDCFGSGQTYVDNRVVSEKKISAIYLKLCFREDRVSYWNQENIYLEGREYYNKPDSLFKTREEAEAALAKMSGGGPNA